MMSAIVEFIHYNNWANRQVLAACQALSEDQLAASAPGAFGTVRDTLAHIIRAEASYAGRLTGTRPQPSFSWEDKPSLAELALFATQVGDALVDAVTRSQPTDFVQQKARTEGEITRYRAIALWIQIINHGVEHRTNITTILTQQGLTPPEVDGWNYLMSNIDRLGA